MFGGVCWCVLGCANACVWREGGRKEVRMRAVLGLQVQDVAVEGEWGSGWLCRSVIAMLVCAPATTTHPELCTAAIWQNSSREPTHLHRHPVCHNFGQLPRHIRLDSRQVCRAEQQPQRALQHLGHRRAAVPPAHRVRRFCGTLFSYRSPHEGDTPSRRIHHRSPFPMYPTLAGCSCGCCMEELQQPTMGQKHVLGLQQGQV